MVDEDENVAPVQTDWRRLTEGTLLRSSSLVLISCTLVLLSSFVIAGCSEGGDDPVALARQVESIIRPICSEAVFSDQYTGLLEPEEWADIQRESPTTGEAMGRRFDEALESLYELHRTADLEPFTFNALLTVINDMDSALTHHVRAWDALQEGDTFDWINHLSLLDHSCGAAISANYMMSTRDF